MVYLPEKRILLMALRWKWDPVITTSADYGASWALPQQLNTAQTTTLCNLKGGNLILSNLASGSSNRWFSSDFGETWVSRDVTVAVGDTWDPPLLITTVRTDGSASSCLAETRYYHTPPGKSQAYIWFSTDGLSWSNEQVPPQWLGVNEVALTQASNGDLVAACRTDLPVRFENTHFDEYSGLGVSISSDNGSTWTSLNELYDWGRHHASMVQLSNGDIVMSYVVRQGYTRSQDGFPRYGIEAVVSRDNGQTWDLDHRYILSAWKGQINDGILGHEYHGGCASTSSVLLPDDFILTPKQA